MSPIPREPPVTSATLPSTENSFEASTASPPRPEGIRPRRERGRGERTPRATRALVGGAGLYRVLGRAGARGGAGPGAPGYFGSAARSSSISGLNDGRE